MTAPLEVRSQELFALLARRDHDGAVDLVLRLAEDGLAVPQLLTEVIAPAQRRVGQLWHCGDWSVADESAATAVADAAVAAISAARRGPSSPGAPAVVVACPEGEWHSLPARIFTELARRQGATTTFLGPSVPADHLARFVQKLRPDVVALSCSTALSFPALVAATAAVHGVSVPVIAGGLALGDDPARASAMGADAWASGPEAIDAALVGRATASGAVQSPDVAANSLRLALERPAVVTRAMAELERRLPALASFDDRQRQRTREDFDYICR